MQLRPIATVALAIALVACAPSVYLSRSEVAPIGTGDFGQPPGDWTWEKEGVRVIVLPDRLALTLLIQNEGTESARVIWDETVLVVGGQADRVVHQGVVLAQRRASQPASIVPPGANLTDRLNGAGRFEFVSGIGWVIGWVEYPAWATATGETFFQFYGARTVQVFELKPRRVELALAIQIGDTLHRPRFTFEFMGRPDPDSPSGWVRTRYP